MATRSNWLHHVPPLRIPRRSRHHHHRGLLELIAMAMGWIILGQLILVVWLYEATIWACIWFYYGLFLGCRWIYRNNVLGQTAATLMRRRKPQPQPNGPYAGLGATTPLPQPVDLAEYGQWDGPTRRRT